MSDGTSTPVGGDHLPASMHQPVSRDAWIMLIFNTTAFTICFAAWMMNGVLITFLVDNGVYNWDPAEMGWLIGIPVLTGALMRLPMGVLTDKYGGRWVYGFLLIGAALPMFLVSFCDSFWTFFVAGLGFGMAGTSFAIGIAYTSVWFPKHRQGLALGIFGAGNAGAALTSLLAPTILRWLTNVGTANEDLDGWRSLPIVYAFALLLMGIVFLLFTKNRIPEGSAQKTLKQRMEPLKELRVWRFGLYYFFVFGGFVALAQWLIPYYVNVYTMPVVTAGLLASLFSLPSGVIRALGGWLSDLAGARTVMYWVFGLSLVCFLFLMVPQMDVYLPGRGVMSRVKGTVVKVDDEKGIIEVRRDRDGKVVAHHFQPKEGELVTIDERQKGMLVLPRGMSWQERMVRIEEGKPVAKRELLARGVTHIFFQANVWIFTGLIFIIGVLTGIGKAGVYKYIPDYFPRDVGVVGGIVGVLGGLGGFVCPIIFGYLLKLTNIWTTCWMFFFVLTAACMLWLHMVVRSILKKEAPEQLDRIEAVLEENIFEKEEKPITVETEDGRAASKPTHAT